MMIGFPLALAAQVAVPFVGCRSDGQQGPQPAPTGKSKQVQVDSATAAALAFYQSEGDLGILAPRGWYCFGTYGSSGATLMISSQPIDASKIFSGSWLGLPEWAMVFSESYGDTSGRFTVGEVIARVFPAYRSYVTELTKDPDFPPTPTVPYPNDTLTYKTKSIVEYRTPPHAKGLGTRSWLKPSENPIEGVAMLVGQAPNLRLLSVRLPPAISPLTTVIIHQFERDALKP